MAMDSPPPISLEEAVKLLEKELWLKTIEDVVEKLTKDGGNDYLALGIRIHSFTKYECETLIRKI